MKNDLVRVIANIVALLATIVVNFLANALPINGVTTAEVSDMFQVFFVPAGYVFAIWGVIYLFLLGFVIYQALPAQHANPRLRRIGWLFVLTNIANITWIFLWQYQLFLLTLVAMLTLLGSLIVIYTRLDIGKAQVPLAQKLLVDVPFSIYLAWVSVATIANVTDVLSYLNWNGFGLSPQFWFVVMAGVVVLLAGWMGFVRRDIAFLLVIIWALSGIAIKQAAFPLVANTAWIATALVALMLIPLLIYGRRPAGRQSVA